MRKNFKNVIIIVLMFLVGFGSYYFIDKIVYKHKWADQTENVVENTASDELKENTIEENKVEENEIKENHNENKEKTENKTIKKVELTEDEIVNILIDASSFNDVSELSTETKLKIIYNALNENKIKAYANRGDGQTTVEYTEGEVNGIVYSLFGSELRENKSYGEVFVYKNGKYILEHSDRGSQTHIAKNIRTDAAAGTAYIGYDLYYSENGNEEFKGRYEIGINGTTSFVTCKKGL